MLRRYTDCVKYLAHILHNSSQFYKDRGNYRDPAFNTSEPMMEKMWCLLTLAHRVSPQALDSDIQAQVKERSQKKLAELFDLCCPAFIDPTLPPNISKSKLSAEVINRPVFDTQKKIFLAEVQQRNLLPQVYNDLKMCTNVNVSKITRFIEQQQQEKDERKKSSSSTTTTTSAAAQAKIDEEQTYTLLMKFKHKTRNLRWQAGGSTSGGKWMSTSEIDFQVDKDVVSVREPSTQGSSAQYFIRGVTIQQDLQFALRQW